jgi:carbon monoxide dehydrogenase subunit G
LRLENEFDVPISIDEAWNLFTTVERIAPCMPGAELTDVVDDRTYQGHANVKLGPIRLRFDGVACFENIDRENHEVVILAKGREKAGKGNAEALITSRLAPRNGRTLVSIVTNLTLTGPIAHYGRQGVISDVSSQLIGQFAQCLEAQLIGGEGEARTEVERGRDVRGVSVGLKALWNSLVRSINKFLRWLHVRR